MINSEFYEDINTLIYFYYNNIIIKILLDIESTSFYC